MKKLVCAVSLILVFFSTFACKDKEVQAAVAEMKAQAELEARNIEVIKKLFAELSKRNAEIFYELYAPDSRYFFPSRISTPISRDAEVAQAKTFFAALPDLTDEVVDIFAIKDRVIARIIARGTHQAEMEGIAATGNKAEISALLIFRLKDGKIVEEVEEADLLGFYQQLGMELKPKAAKK